MVNVKNEAPPRWRKPSETAIPSTLDKRTSPRLYCACGRVGRILGAHGLTISGRLSGITTSSITFGSPIALVNAYIECSLIPRNTSSRQLLNRTTIPAPNTDRIIVIKLISRCI